MHEWKIGELAVCVDNHGYLPPETAPKLESVYVVRHFHPEDLTVYDSLWFHNLINGASPLSGDFSIDGSAGYLAADFRPLDDSDIQRITEKHKDSLPKRSLVKDDAEARKRIEELTGVKLSPPWDSGEAPFIFDDIKQDWVRWYPK